MNVMWYTMCMNVFPVPRGTLLFLISRVRAIPSSATTLHSPVLSHYFVFSLYFHYLFDFRVKGWKGNRLTVPMNTRDFVVWKSDTSRPKTNPGILFPRFLRLYIYTESNTIFTSILFFIRIMFTYQRSTSVRIVKT